MEKHTPISIETTIQAPVEKVWQIWSDPEHIRQWNTATPEWHTPHAENDLRTGGKFSSRMEAKDGSFGFDFGGVYDEVRENDYIAYTMDDGRKVNVTFYPQEGSTRVVEIFEPEQTNPAGLQQQGWQAILDNFKRYTESAAV